MKHKVMVAVLAAAMAAAGCGSKDEPAAAGKTIEPTTKVEPAVALTAPTLGIDAIKKLNYGYGAGAKDHERAVAAYKAKPRDWAGVRSAAEAALAKDASHLDAHRLLASALAQTAGEPAAIADHLLYAIGADWLRWGPKIEADPDLASFWPTPQGKALAAMLPELDADFRTRAKTGLWLLGRRSTFKWPAKPGAQYGATRGELFAYDVASKRYLRLTHTDYTVAAWLRSPSSTEVAMIRYDKVDLPDPVKIKNGAPLLARSSVESFDADTLEPMAKKASLPAARAVAVTWGTGDQLLALTAPAKARWDLGPTMAFSIDRTTGKTAKTKTPTTLPAVAWVTFDDVVFDGPGEGVEASWDAAGTSAEVTLTASKQKLALGDGDRVVRGSIAWSPSKARVAVATASDACAKEAEAQKSALYVADAATGKLKHLLTAASRFTVRWLSDDVLAYEDGAGGIRIYDAAAGKEVGHLTEKAGMAIAGLSASPKPICKQAPFETEEKADATEAVPLPPEEAAGPATSPE